jgi:hypothetical protein
MYGSGTDKLAHLTGRARRSVHFNRPQKLSIMAFEGDMLCQAALTDKTRQKRSTVQSCKPVQCLAKTIFTTNTKVNDTLRKPKHVTASPQQQQPAFRGQKHGTQDTYRSIHRCAL